MVDVHVAGLGGKAGCVTCRAHRLAGDVALPHASGTSTLQICGHPPSTHSPTHPPHRHPTSSARMASSRSRMLASGCRRQYFLPMSGAGIPVQLGNLPSSKSLIARVYVATAWAEGWRAGVEQGWRAGSGRRRGGTAALLLRRRSAARASLPCRLQRTNTRTPAPPGSRQRNGRCEARACTTKGRRGI